ncbi:MAG: D-hexose-6-phosphate mutarotase [Betaproteobacteria bacterium]|nr:D-hexose-6-phosphate mutarotase [Betaproteobacteria bacterium]
MTPAQLNAQFGIAGQLVFEEGQGGLTFARIDNAQGEAVLCLQGAHLVSWRPKDQAEPVVWVSDLAKYAPGKSIRGGAPVCWPWFGAHKTESGFPGHGYARTVPWAVTGSAVLADGATEITLTLIENDQARAQWPHNTRVELRAVVGAKLTLSLTTTNQGDAPVEIGEALHTYLRIGDIGEIAITGLEGCTYLDKVDGGQRKTQAGAVTCTGEVDRVYVNTTAACVIEDARLKRNVLIEKTGSAATVVWTPWTEKADKMGDFGPDGWRRMVCVESANAADNVVTVAPGQSHTLTAVYSAQTL